MKRCEQLEQLSREHDDCLVMAKRIADIAKDGSEEKLIQGIDIVKKYNDTELEAHLQHEEQTIFRPLITQYPEHLKLCITLGKEHGFLRTLVEGISLKTAKEDLADFARVLESHTKLEENELFPLLSSLLTKEQLDTVLNFVPWNR
jgi:hemerythrin-like domain-containing protein